MSIHKVLDLKRPLILLDIETTSGDPATARIIQYGQVVYFPDGRRLTFQTLVNPLCPIPARSTEVHGITDEIILHGCAKCSKTKEAHPELGCDTWRPIPKFSDLATNIYRGFQNVDFAGYNHRTFDMKVMVTELGRSGFKLDLSDAKLIDAYRLWMQLEKRKLADFVRRYGKQKLENAHDAMADVLGTEIGLIGCLEEHQDLPRTVPELHDFIFPPDPSAIDPDGKFVFVDGVPCFNFGKNRGQPVKTNLGYIQWMIKSDFSPEVKAVCEILARNKGQYPTTLPLESASVESPSDST